MRQAILALLALAAALAVAVSAAPEVSFQEIEESLTCQCGCGLTVHSCNHLQCPSALPLRDEIRTHMAAGESKDVILAAFAAKYGEKILSAPTTQGFNLLAWTTPFVLLGIGGVFLFLTLRRWRTRSVAAPATAPAAPAEAASTAHQRTLERELRDFEP